MAVLLDALRAVGSGRVLDEVLVLVLDSALAVTGAERGFIMLAEAGGALEFTLGRGRNHVTLPGQTFPTSRKIPEEVFATGEPRVVADLLDADLAGDHVGTIALGIRHVLCVPLGLVRYADGPAAVEPPRRIGVLYLDGRDRGTLLSPTTRAALETLAGEAALVIENARLYRQAIEKARLEQQMAIAADIQRALLPELHHSGRRVRAGVPLGPLSGDWRRLLRLRRLAGPRVRLRARRHLREGPAGGVADGGRAGRFRDRGLTRSLAGQNAHRPQRNVDPKSDRGDDSPRSSTVRYRATGV